MNVLLVYPSYPDTFWSFKHILPFLSKKAAFPPLGLVTVAAMLPEDWSKRLVDLNVRPLLEEDLAWADMVFLSAMLIQEQSACEVIAKARALGKRVVAGGPAFSITPERFSGVDHFVLDEGEVTVPLFLADLEKGEPKPMYTSTERPDLSRTPLPLWELIDFRDYVSMPVQYSRGCPFDCEFCGIVAMNGRVPRVKSPSQMLSELQHLYDAGWRRNIFIVDDNFIGNKRKVKELLPQVIAWQKEHSYPFTFMTEASINLADDAELMRLMSEANFSKVFVGIETPSVDCLKECGKFQNVNADFTAAIKTINRNGMQVMGGFIVGFDSDTESIFERQIRFIQENGVVTAMVGMLNALPRTRLWQRLQSENRLLGIPKGNNTDILPNFIPRMDLEKLVKGYRKIQSSIYSTKMYYKRINTFIANYKPTVRASTDIAEVKAFLKSMWYIGVLSRARMRYWTLLIRTLLTKRRAFAAAVELAIIGRHFEYMARSIARSELILPVPETAAADGDISC